MLRRGPKSSEVAQSALNSVYSEESNSFFYRNQKYKAMTYCDLIHSDTAEVLSRDECDFYKGMYALTKNKFGSDIGYYLACRTDKEFLYKFYNDMIKESGIEKIINLEYTQNIMIKERENETEKYIFMMNFSSEANTVDGIRLKDMK